MTAERRNTEKKKNLARHQITAEMRDICSIATAYRSTPRALADAAAEERRRFHKQKSRPLAEEGGGAVDDLSTAVPARGIAARGESGSVRVFRALKKWVASAGNVARGSRGGSERRAR